MKSGERKKVEETCKIEATIMKRLRWVLISHSWSCHSTLLMRLFRLLPSHPLIVAFYGIMTTDQNFFGLIFERCTLGDLRALLNNRDVHLSNQQKARILMDIAQVLCEIILSALAVVCRLIF